MLTYTTNEYIHGNGIFVQAWDDFEPFTECSVNLIDYGIILEEDQIAVPAYKIPEPYRSEIINDLAKEVIGSVFFGPFSSEAIIIRLKDEYLQNEEVENDE